MPNITHQNMNLPVKSVLALKALNALNIIRIFT